MLIVVQIDLAGADLELFELYERRVIALLPEFGGKLERRLRGVERSVETHILRFESQVDFDRYLADPRRAALAPLWERSRAKSLRWEVAEV